MDPLLIALPNGPPPKSPPPNGPSPNSPPPNGPPPNSPPNMRIGSSGNHGEGPKPFNNPKSSNDPKPPNSSNDPKSPNSSNDPKSPNSSNDPKSPKPPNDPNGGNRIGTNNAPEDLEKELPSKGRSSRRVVAGAGKLRLMKNAKKARRNREEEVVLEESSESEEYDYNKKSTNDQMTEQRIAELKKNVDTVKDSVTKQCEGIVSILPDTRTNSIPHEDIPLFINMNNQDKNVRFWKKMFQNESNIEGITLELSHNRWFPNMLFMLPNAQRGAKKSFMCNSEICSLVQYYQLVCEDLMNEQVKMSKKCYTTQCSDADVVRLRNMIAFPKEECSENNLYDFMQVIIKMFSNSSFLYSQCELLEKMINLPTFVNPKANGIAPMETEFVASANMVIGMCFSFCALYESIAQEKEGVIKLIQYCNSIPKAKTQEAHMIALRENLIKYGIHVSDTQDRGAFNIHPDLIEVGEKIRDLINKLIAVSRQCNTSVNNDRMLSMQKCLRQCNTRIDRTIKEQGKILRSDMVQYMSGVKSADDTGAKLWEAMNPSIVRNFAECQVYEEKIAEDVQVSDAVFCGVIDEPNMLAGIQAMFIETINNSDEYQERQDYNPQTERERLDFGRSLGKTDNVNLYITTVDSEDKKYKKHVLWLEDKKANRLWPLLNNDVLYMFSANSLLSGDELLSHFTENLQASSVHTMLDKLSCSMIEYWKYMSLIKFRIDVISSVVKDDKCVPELLDCLDGLVATLSTLYEVGEFLQAKWASFIELRFHDSDMGVTSNDPCAYDLWKYSEWVYQCQQGPLSSIIDDIKGVCKTMGNNQKALKIQSDLSALKDKYPQAEEFFCNSDTQGFAERLSEIWAKKIKEKSKVVKGMPSCPAAINRRKSFPYPLLNEPKGNEKSNLVVLADTGKVTKDSVLHMAMMESNCFEDQPYIHYVRQHSPIGNYPEVVMQMTLDSGASCVIHTKVVLKNNRDCIWDNADIRDNIPHHNHAPYDALDEYGEIVDPRQRYRFRGV